MFKSHSKSLIFTTLRAKQAYTTHVYFQREVFLFSRKKNIWTISDTNIKNIIFNHCVKDHLIYLWPFCSVLFSWSWQPFLFLQTNLSFIISAVNRLLIIEYCSKASSSMFYRRSKRESPSASKGAASFVLLLVATALSTRFSSRWRFSEKILSVSSSHLQRKNATKYE